MIRPGLSHWAAVAAILALGACHAQPKAGHGEVSGQILPGSVSDAMLPYDSVKSKAPLAPREAESQAGDEGDGKADLSADAADSSSDTATPEVSASSAPGAVSSSN